MKPFKPEQYHNPIDGAVSEIISAMSALNMEPHPLASPSGRYLSETDHWVAHAIEHLNAALDCIRAHQSPVSHIPPLPSPYDGMTQEEKDKAHASQVQRMIDEGV